MLAYPFLMLLLLECRARACLIVRGLLIGFVRVAQGCFGTGWEMFGGGWLVVEFSLGGRWFGGRGWGLTNRLDRPPQTTVDDSYRIRHAELGRFSPFRSISMKVFGILMCLGFLVLIARNRGLSLTPFKAAAIATVLYYFAFASAMYVAVTVKDPFAVIIPLMVAAPTSLPILYNKAVGIALVQSGPLTFTITLVSIGIANGAIWFGAVFALAEFSNRIRRLFPRNS